jgi:hypothetical protein
MNSCANALLSLSPYTDEFRPACGNIHHHQGVQVETIQTFPTMRHQIDLDKARTVLLPVCKGANGDGAPE